MFRLCCYSKSVLVDSITLFSCRNSSVATKTFTPLEIRGLTDVNTRSYEASTEPERKAPLHLKFSEVIDWTNIWPSAATFHYSTVPFPIRQGYCKNLAENKGVSPGYYANPELMKIPNFLHLTKAHIKKHCDAIKKFCTQWPEGLKDEATILKYYPVEVVQRSYVFSASNIRDPRARRVELSVPVSSLSLDGDAKRKLIRLTMGPGPGRSIARYDWGTDMLHLVSDRCPTSRQNADFLLYVLTVLTLECRKVEHWEKDSAQYDWLKFDWFTSSSRAHLLSYLGQDSAKKTADADKQTSAAKHQLPLDSDPAVLRYRQALESIWRAHDLLHGDQWLARPDPPPRRICLYPPIRSQPFEPVPGLDDAANIKQYGQATRQLFCLNS